MKVILTPFIILIITFLSQQIKITVSRGESTVIVVDSMLFSFVLTPEKRKMRPLRILKNTRHIMNAISYLFKNSRVRYRYLNSAEGTQNGKAHHLILYTQVINLPISLIIFLYSRFKNRVRKMMKGVRQQIK